MKIWSVSLKTLTVLKTSAPGWKNDQKPIFRLITFNHIETILNGSFLKYFWWYSLQKHKWSNKTLLKIQNKLFYLNIFFPLAFVWLMFESVINAYLCSFKCTELKMNLFFIFTVCHIVFIDSHDFYCDIFCQMNKNDLKIDKIYRIIIYMIWLSWARNSCRLLKKPNCLLQFKFFLSAFLLECDKILHNSWTHFFLKIYIFMSGYLEMCECKTVE